MVCAKRAPWFAPSSIPVSATHIKIEITPKTHPKLKNNKKKIWEKSTKLTSDNCGVGVEPVD